jgi:hypothetical protein
LVRALSDAQYDIFWIVEEDKGVGRGSEVISRTYLAVNHE